MSTGALASASSIGVIAACVAAASRIAMRARNRFADCAVSGLSLRDEAFLYSLGPFALDRLER
ncbi:hypothetical protein, partial [Burkholderia multivorans]|uniref:hypothetical protein n=1 Tax=Burkholderia multivorans TaxID=87883 RepID=UPI001C658B9F